MKKPKKKRKNRFTTAYREMQQVKKDQRIQRIYDLWRMLKPPTGEN